MIILKKEALNQYQVKYKSNEGQDIERGADTQAFNDCGRTALIWAARKGNTEIVKLLIDNGADIHAQGSNGDTALTLAARNGHTIIVALLQTA